MSGKRKRKTDTTSSSDSTEFVPESTSSSSSSTPGDSEWIPPSTEPRHQHLQQLHQQLPGQPSPQPTTIRTTTRTTTTATRRTGRSVPRPMDFNLKPLTIDNRPKASYVPLPGDPGYDPELAAAAKKRVIILRNHDGWYCPICDQEYLAKDEETTFSGEYCRVCLNRMGKGTRLKVFIDFMLFKFKFKMYE